MSLSSELCTSSGGLNTGGNLSESSFLEGLFGLELGHADFADDADFSSLLFVCPTDFTEFHRSLPYAGWDFADFADDADFLLCCLFVPQISRNSTDFCPMRAGISQIMQMTQIFLQLIYHPSRFTGRNRVNY